MGFSAARQTVLVIAGRACGASSRARLRRSRPCTVRQGGLSFRLSRPRREPWQFACWRPCRRPCWRPCTRRGGSPPRFSAPSCLPACPGDGWPRHAAIAGCGNRPSQAVLHRLLQFRVGRASRHVPCAFAPPVTFGVQERQCLPHGTLRIPLTRDGRAEPDAILAPADGWATGGPKRRLHTLRCEPLGMLRHRNLERRGGVSTTDCIHPVPGDPLPQPLPRRRHHPQRRSRRRRARPRARRDDQRAVQERGDPSSRATESRKDPGRFSEQPHSAPGPTHKPAAP